MADFAPTYQALARISARYPHFPLESAALVRLVTHTHKRLHDHLSALLKVYGINHPEYTVLIMLYGADGGSMSPTELAELTHEKSTNVTRLTNELVKKALISRSLVDGDRRKLDLRLTRKGEKLLESLLPPICEFANGRGEQFSDKEKAQLKKLLQKLLHELGD